METLETLSKFTDKYPQIVEGKLKYSFLGGTGVRLLQESINYKEKRPISDFDLLVFESNENYPVHNCSTNDVYGVISSNSKELLEYVDSVNIKGKNYFFMNGTFLALTKTCAIDNPREKDFKDVSFLNSEKAIDFKKLDPFYRRATRLTNRSEISIKTLKWILKNKNLRLFQTFPRFVNLMSEFENFEKARDIINSYSEEDQEKDGYALASIIYDTHSLIRELSNLSEEEKLIGLGKILIKAEKNDYVDFDRIIHYDLIPKFRYASKTEKRRILKDLSD